MAELGRLGHPSPSHSQMLRINYDRDVDMFNLFHLLRKRSLLCCWLWKYEASRDGSLSRYRLQAECGKSTRRIPRLDDSLSTSEYKSVLSSHILPVICSLVLETSQHWCSDPPWPLWKVFTDRLGLFPIPRASCGFLDRRPSITGYGKSSSYETMESS